MDKLINDGVKVDMILTDPPYGTTACKWDSVIPFNDYVEILDKGKIHIEYEEESVLRYVKNGTSYDTAKQIFDRDKKKGMWSYLNKLIKPNGAIVLFGSQPFTAKLIMSNLKNYKHYWVWNKELCGAFALAKKRPMIITEEICIFSSSGRVNYYPLMEDAQVKNIRPINVGSSVSVATFISSGIAKSGKDYDNKKRYPRNIIKYSKYNAECNQVNRIHPTQKPVALMEYLIKTYTNEDEIVLDFTMGSGSTGVACINTGRSFIGIEKDDTYFDISVDRIKKHIEDNNLEVDLNTY